MNIKQKIVKAMIEGCLVRRTFRYLANIPKHLWKRLVKFFNKVCNKIDYNIGTYARIQITQTLPIQQNKIVFMTYNNSFMCNPKYIAEEIYRQKLPYELVWITNAINNNSMFEFPSYLKLAQRGTYSAFHELMTAKIWIDNSFNCIWQPLPKKDGQYYLETWHGSLGLKRVGAGDVSDKYWVKRASAAKNYTNYCISNSTFETNVFRETYWPETPILNYGHARNDILLCTDLERIQEIKAKVYSYFGLNKNEKLLLYAPTFRDSKNFDCYNIDFDRVLAALSKRFGGKWKVLLRHHFHNRKAGRKIKGNSYILNATNYLDMQELLVACDVGISDYSSWVCDFVLTHKPTFLYTVDLEEYNNERGLYYPLETTPFPIAKNNDELIQEILNFDHERYVQDAKRFLDEKGCIDDGHAAKRIVEKIKEIMASSEV